MGGAIYVNQPHIGGHTCQGWYCQPEKKYFLFKHLGNILTPSWVWSLGGNIFPALPSWAHASISSVEPFFWIRAQSQSDYRTVLNWTSLKVFLKKYYVKRKQTLSLLYRNLIVWYPPTQVLTEQYSTTSSSSEFDEITLFFYHWEVWWFLSSPGPSLSPGPCPNRPPSQIKVPKKRKKKDLDLGLTLKSHGPPPTHNF